MKREIKRVSCGEKIGSVDHILGIHRTESEFNPRNSYSTLGIHRTESESYKLGQSKKYIINKIGRVGKGRHRVQMKALIFSFIKTCNQNIL